MYSRSIAVVALLLLSFVFATAATADDAAPRIKALQAQAQLRLGQTPKGWSRSQFRVCPAYDQCMRGCVQDPKTRDYAKRLCKDCDVTPAMINSICGLGVYDGDWLAYPGCRMMANAQDCQVDGPAPPPRQIRR